MGKESDRLSEIHDPCDRAFAHWKIACAERCAAGEELLATQTACRIVACPIPDSATDTAIDRAAADVAYFRRAFCAALESHAASEAAFNRMREAYRLAQERFDLLIAGEL